MAETPKILFMGDNRGTSAYLKENLMLKGGFFVSSETNNSAALETFKQDNFDVVIVKLDRTYPEGMDFIRALKKLNPQCVIIAFLENNNPDLLREASALGIYDFVAEPFNFEQLFFLIKKGAQLHSLMFTHDRLFKSIQEQNIYLQKQNTVLAKRIEESTKNLTRLYEDLRSTYIRTIKALAQAIDARDHYTHSHSENVAKCAVVIAEQMKLSTKDIEMIREACELHDLGKIGIQDLVLSKPSSLTEEEWKQIRRHPETAAQILEPLTFLGDVIEIIRQHHEHYDGSGYPQGLKGDEIILGARIINLADAYDAMRSARAYRKNALTKDEAIFEIKRNSGKQFDPRVVEAFLEVVDKLPL